VPEGIVLRDATPGDEAFLRRVYADVRAPELALVAWSDAEKQAFCDMQYTLQDRHYREHYPGARFLVIEAGGNPVGRLIVQRTARELRLMDIALITMRRGQGIGGSLIRELLAEADRDDLAVVLYVEQANPVRVFYEQLGFVCDGEAGLYRRMVRPPRPRD
jgi:GNAT superfamily N-acetyltransferase